MSILKNTIALSNQQSKKVWKQVDTKTLGTQNVLIYGTGEIGKSISTLFTPLVNEVIGINSTGKIAPQFAQVYKEDIKSPEAKNIDIVINTLPLTAKTHEFFNKRTLSKFNEAIFINVGRGKSVSINDLIEALEKAVISHAVLDVFAIEPLPHEHPLWHHENVIITPHQAGVTTLEDVIESFELAFEHYISGQKKSCFTNSEKGY